MDHTTWMYLKGFTSVSTFPLQWHQHVGHPSLDKLCQVVTGLSHVFVLECEARQLVKHHCSFLSRHVESHQLQLF